MFTIISIMFIGIGIGYLMRNVQMLQKVEKSASLTILLLLFVLGVSIGSNRLIVDNLGRFGWQAAVLASLSITGSMLASLMVFHLFFKKGEKKRNEKMERQSQYSIGNLHDSWRNGKLSNLGRSKE